MIGAYTVKGKLSLKRERFLSSCVYRWNWHWLILILYFASRKFWRKKSNFFWYIDLICCNFEPNLQTIKVHSNQLTHFKSKIIEMVNSWPDVGYYYKLNIEIFWFKIFFALNKLGTLIQYLAFNCTVCWFICIFVHLV